MYPRSYFAGRYFAPTYWPESQGVVPDVIYAPAVRRPGSVLRHRGRR